MTMARTPPDAGPMDLDAAPPPVFLVGRRSDDFFTVSMATSSSLVSDWDCNFGNIILKVHRLSDVP